MSNSIVPSNLDDKINIDLFLSTNKNKPVVAVQGLGFVGSAMSVAAGLSKNKVIEW